MLGTGNEEDVLKANFISIAIINPVTFRIGFISFFPETKLVKKGKTIERQLLSENFLSVIELISKKLSIDIPFHLYFSMEDITTALDMVEGINFFLWQPYLLENEKLPTGEFLMDSTLISDFLNVTDKSKYASSIKLYRYYSLILNAWNHRKEKWDILKNEIIFGKVTQNLQTSLSTYELYFLAETLLHDQKWMPIFFEIPVQQEKDSFIMNQDATAFYFKDFMQKLNQEKNFYLDTSPNIEIKNGTTIPNLAKKMRNRFSQKGFKVLEFANADKHDYQNTILLDIGGSSFYLQAAAKSLKINRNYHLINRSIFTDLVLILGRDYQEIISFED